MPWVYMVGRLGVLSSNLVMSILGSRVASLDDRRTSKAWSHSEGPLALLTPQIKPKANSTGEAAAT